MKKKTGFTLVELLAVIVILAIILAIAVPGISGIIKNATKKSFESDAKMVLQAIEYKKLENENFDIAGFNLNYIADELNLSIDNYEQVIAEIQDDQVRITIVGQNKWDGLTAYGTIKNMRVVDSENYDVVPPIITLVGDNPLTVEAGGTFTDPGATASDNKDGDVTSDIQVTGSVNTTNIGTYTLTYIVTDSGGNESDPITRTVNVVDAGAPVITLNGNTTVSLYVGGSYSDAGATATDNVDGNITSNIITTSNVNTSVVGTYTVTYRVTDSVGNEATPVVRTVRVIGVNLADVSVGQLHYRSMALYNNQYYIYWPSGTSIGYRILNSQLQTVSSGSFPMNGSTYDASVISLSTNTGSLIWTGLRNNHYYGGHLSSGNSFGWHNAGYMDIASLNGYTILFHTGRSDGNYACITNVNTSSYVSTYYSDGGWGESWRVFPYSSDTALAFGNASGKLKVTVNSSGTISTQQNPAEIPSELSGSYSYFGRMQMDNNKKFHYMTSGNIYKSPLGSVTLNVDSGTVNDYVLNIHPSLSVTATLIDGNKFNYRIINHANNQIIRSQTYTLDNTYSYLVPIQSVGNSNESVFIIQNSNRSLSRAISIGLPSV